jgi:plastocyanin
MNSKTIAVIIVVLVLLGGGVYLYSRSKQAKAPSNETMSYGNQQESMPAENVPANNTTPPDTMSSNSQPANTPAGSHFSNEGDSSGQGTVHEIDFDGSSFSPASLSVKAGDTVVFKNKGSGAFWPASNPHPAHTDYPGFDSEKPVAAGGSYQFIFTKVGTWGYHNHMAASQRGTITVTQ